MAKPYKTPGVYVEEISKFPPSITEVQTAIPAFIGFTEKAKKDGEDMTLKPVRISSLMEYVDVFGEAQPEENLVVNIETTPKGVRYNVDFDWTDGKGPSRHILYYAMQQFFENGGGPCYIISVGGFTAIGTVISDATPFLNGLEELKKLDEPTLIIVPEGQGMDKDTYFTITGNALDQCVDLMDRFVIMDMHKDARTLKTAGDILALAQEFRNSLNKDAAFRRYGAVYFPNIRSTFNYYRTDSAIKIIVDNTDKTFDELNSLQKANVKLAVDSFSINLPPSASIAGVYCRVDNMRGVWKAPANESLSAVSGITCDINDKIQETLNVDEDAGISINAIRFFPGRGIKVWGARTMDGNSNEWRYISVRRYFNMVEESTKKATEQFVFEPNDANTWVKTKAMIENFLINQWRAGALAGVKPEHAFYVKVGLNETMTAFDILEGRMIVEIGLAVVRPAEFIILKFSHKMQES